MATVNDNKGQRKRVISRFGDMRNNLGNKVACMNRSKSQMGINVLTRLKRIHLDTVLLFALTLAACTGGPPITSTVAPTPTPTRWLPKSGDLEQAVDGGKIIASWRPTSVGGTGCLADLGFAIETADISIEGGLGEYVTDYRNCTGEDVAKALIGIRTSAFDPLSDQMLDALDQFLAELQSFPQLEYVFDPRSGGHEEVVDEGSAKFFWTKTTDNQCSLTVDFSGNMGHIPGFVVLTADSPYTDIIQEASGGCNFDHLISLVEYSFPTGSDQDTRAKAEVLRSFYNKLLLARDHASGEIEKSVAGESVSLLWVTGIEEDDQLHCKLYMESLNFWTISGEFVSNDRPCTAETIASALEAVRPSASELSDQVSEAIDQFIADLQP